MTDSDNNRTTIDTEAAALAFAILNTAKSLIDRTSTDLEYAYLGLHGEEGQRRYTDDIGRGIRDRHIRQHLEEVRELLEALAKLNQGEEAT
jgi:hypothetical protein